MIGRIMGGLAALALVLGVGVGSASAAAAPKAKKKGVSTISAISEDGKTITIETKKGKKDPGEKKEIKIAVAAKTEFPADTKDEDKKLKVGQAVEITFVKDSADTAELVKVVPFAAKKKKKPAA